MRNTKASSVKSLEKLEMRTLYSVGGTYAVPLTPRVTIDEDPAWSLNGGAAVNLPYVRDATNGSTGTDTFTKTIASTSAMVGKKIYLHFEGAFLQTNLSIDGTAVDLNPATTAVDAHLGGFQAFDFDVTAAMLRTIGNHTFVITVNSNNNSNVSPGSGGDYFRQGGIYRDLSLIIVNPTQIALSENVGHLGLASQAADTTSQISSPGVRFSNDDVVIGAASTTVHVTTVLNDLAAAAQNVSVTSYLVDAAGVTRAQGTTNTSLTAGQTGSAVTQDMTVANPHLWDGRIDPYLYTLYVEVRDAGSNQLLDLQKQNVGIRTIKINNPSSAAAAVTNPPFVLNGHAYRVVGADMHQDTGLLDSRGNAAGWERSDAQTRADIDLLAAMGGTAIRTSHYQDSQAFYDYCDKVGILVYTEMNINGSVATGDAFASNAEDQYQELIRQNYNHPSIFAWGFGNETGDSSQLLNLVKQFQKIAKGTTVTNSTTGVKTVVLAAGDPTPLDSHRYTAWAMNGGTTPGYTSNGNGTSSPSNSYGVADIMGTHPYTYWYGGSGGPSQQLLQPQGITEYSGGGSPYQYTHNNFTLPVNSNGLGGVTTTYHPENQHLQINERQYTDLTNLGYYWGQFTWQMFDHPDGKTEGAVTHTNDKGLVTRDRVPKDSYYFYQAALNDPTRSWGNAKVLRLSERSWTVRNQASNSITVFSNLGVPTVTVNGVNVPMQQLVLAGTAISNTYISSSNVNLSVGNNTVNVSRTYAGTNYTDSAVWTYRNAIAGTATARIDFAPAGTTVASGYSLDSGGTYGAQNGQTYGWLPASATVTAVGSTFTTSGDTTTLTKDGVNVNYDLNTRKSSVWEYALPNGTYDVRIGAGQSGTSGYGVNNFALEGVVAAFDTNGDRAQDTFFSRVTITDGKLTLSDAPGAIGSRITYIDINALDLTAPTVVSTTFNYLKGPSIQVQFSENVTGVTAASFVLHNNTTNQNLDSSLFAISINGNIATLTFPGYPAGLPDGTYSATLLAAGITDAANNSLAQNSTFSFFSLAGDANHDGKVDVIDLGMLSSNWQSTTADFSGGDFNNDGIVDVVDLGILSTNWQKTLDLSQLSASKAPSLAAAKRAARISRH